MSALLLELHTGIKLHTLFDFVVVVVDLFCFVRTFHIYREREGGGEGGREGGRERENV